MDDDSTAPVSITSARTSRSDDMHKRKVRYLLSMGIRTACFVLAIVTGGPLRWVLVAGAVFLPYVAVVLANATDQRSQPGPATFAPEDRPRLGSGAASAQSDGPATRDVPDAAGGAGATDAADAAGGAGATDAADATGAADVNRADERKG